MTSTISGIIERSDAIEELIEIARALRLADVGEAAKLRQRQAVDHPLGHAGGSRLVNPGIDQARAHPRLGRRAGGEHQQGADRQNYPHVEPPVVQPRPRAAISRAHALGDRPFCCSSPPSPRWRAFAYVAHRWVMHGPGWFLHASHHRPRDGQLGAERSLRGDLRGALDRAAARRRPARLVAGLYLDRRGDRRLWRDLFRLPRRHRPPPHRPPLSAALAPI